ncbi:hypothetical protein OS493_007334 [Desmophyllum pertusum]|uniref:Uncharacterized protein n=1 Tax=Desmophyllum pertusum TaxID=174260 RepID=A0A9W9Z4J3_9CNID|nr:hypothetical protein OS493_007334 [Desmophyllum pertusum]
MIQKISQPQVMRQAISLTLLWPPATDNSHTDSPDPPDPELNRLSDISSDFDSADRSSGTKPRLREEGEDASAQPHLMVVHVTQEGAQEKHSVHDDVSCATCVTTRKLEFSR